MDSFKDINSIPWNEVPSLFEYSSPGYESSYSAFYGIGTESAYSKVSFIKKVWNLVDRRKWFKNSWSRFFSIIKDFNRLTIDNIKQKDSIVRFPKNILGTLEDALEILSVASNLDKNIEMHVKDAHALIMRIDDKIYKMEDIRKKIPNIKVAGGFKLGLLISDKMLNGYNWPTVMNTTLKHTSGDPDIELPNPSISHKTILGIPATDIGRIVHKVRKGLTWVLVINIILTITAKLYTYRQLHKLDNNLLTDEVNDINRSFKLLMNDLLDIYKIPKQQRDNLEKGFGLGKVIFSPVVKELEKATEPKQKYKYTYEEKVEFVKRMKIINEIDLGDLKELVNKYHSKEYEHLMRGFKAILQTSAKVVNTADDIYAAETFLMLLDTNEFIFQKTTEILLIIAEDLNKF